MKTKLILSLLFGLCALFCYSQNSITQSGCLHVENTEDSVWLTRYENDILALEKQDKQVQEFTCDALFLGSSSFRMWRKMAEDFAPLHVVNRGYGGASIRDLLYNYTRIVGKYQPRNIVFYSENDIIGYKTDIGIGESFDLHRLFFEKLLHDYPQARLYILSVKPSGSRKALMPRHKMLNALFEEYAAKTRRVAYLDVATPLLDGQGEIRPELYLDDNLHLNDEGYRIWTNIIKPRLSPPAGYVYKDTFIRGGGPYQLFTRIYLPKGEGPFPVVITRTPYTFNETRGDNIKQGQEYVRRGLGYIQQYCRGKGGSEGVYQPNVYEREDGRALVNWVAAQPWCRSIGLFGVSYTALTGWIVADSLPDKVKGIYLHHYGIDRHLSAYKDGLFRHDILTGWAIDNASEVSHKPSHDPEEPYYDESRFRPHKEMDVKRLGVELPWYRDWISHPDYSDPYWETGVWGQLRGIPSKIKVPMTIVAGLFDHHLEGTLKGYELLSPETKKNSRLILGGWDHFYQYHPDVSPQPHAKDVDVFADQLDWLHKVVAQGVVPEGNVQVYFIGADCWKTYASWPIRRDKDVVYSLSNRKDAGNHHAYQLLKDRINTPHTGSRQLASSSLKFVYNPLRPVMSVGGETLFNSSARRGSKPQPEIGYRDDVLFFLSPPLEEPLTIAGPVRATIYMSSDCDDTCLTYKISEVMPDGRAYNIRTGITTLAYRNNTYGQAQAYTPNEVVELNIETLPVTWQVKPGSRLRVDITSSDFPQYSIHSNYAGLWSEQVRTRKAHQTIYMDEEHNSRISIPVIEWED
ncbi:CocE/NonD family hydrolase [Bacteroides sp. 51]|uniref:CocE/NonD family hydrolase n=1 Tax=Bacteroides sp. 51 TaxID=2302938 RepID=UPI0013CFE50E|nr:CocE/NonD family hydrolase [Bacteroides sp. 51]NDV83983.1 CocE/NonD family hydrolase [Bacteroides sp. 51]